MNILILKTERLILRPITLLDLDYIHELHSLKETDEFNTLGIPENSEETKLLLEKWIFENNKALTTHFTFAVEFSTGNQIIGLIGINLGKVKYKNAEVWFKFHPNYWNKGFATESLKEILRFGFNELNLHRIEAGCAVGNVGSIHVLEKTGMTREAHTRELLPLSSGWSDNYGYAILATD
ncbi:GNAT family N-acetyltransferase [Flavobacterium sp. Sr18]|uniref:GNAT family N-acetyltransferase n=1 Tax=Flavobacterium sp. Sr18 TaxID=935222 RepID=UPI0013E44AB7|nr:GNAT family N-acetyltransferase [Flavobacterium sp. Sr18]QIH37685.1 GNAT family N-acetyltransferase [Flavobacterium sp. Sr18]